MQVYLNGINNFAKWATWFSTELPVLVRVFGSCKGALFWVEGLKIRCPIVKAQIKVQYNGMWLSGGKEVE